MLEGTNRTSSTCLSRDRCLLQVGCSHEVSPQPPWLDSAWSKVLVEKQHKVCLHRFPWITFIDIWYIITFQEVIHSFSLYEWNENSSFDSKNGLRHPYMPRKLLPGKQSDNTTALWVCTRAHTYIQTHCSLSIHELRHLHLVSAWHVSVYKLNHEVEIWSRQRKTMKLIGTAIRKFKIFSDNCNVKLMCLSVCNCVPWCVVLFTSFLQRSSLTWRRKQNPS